MIIAFTGVISHHIDQLFQSKPMQILGIIMREIAFFVMHIARFFK